MIYIDPPYNTGKDFVYKDNYADNLGNYLALTGQTDEKGKKLSSNTDSDGRYHSNWLNMMYPRLKLARNLLTEDGVIFISIDDNEQANLKKVCDEIFGEENFVLNMILNRTSEIASNNIISKHEYISIYCKSVDWFTVTGKTKHTISRGTVGNPSQTMPIIKFPRGIKCYGISDGEYFETRKIEGSSENIENFQPIIVKGGILENDVELKARWRSSNDMRNFFDNNCKPTKAKINGIIEEIYFDSDRFNPQIKKLTYEKISSLRLDNKRGSDELSQLELNHLDYPKSYRLLKEVFVPINLKNSIILDFFAGSGTTAHAVMALNAEDGGNRKCISVQLPEPTDEKSEANQAGYKTIAEITKERIRRAGELVKKEHADKEGIEKLDVGFRVFKLDSSNIHAWDTSLEKLQDQLDMFDAHDGDHIKADRTEEDVLFEILLKYGLELTLPIQEREIAGCRVYNIGFGTLYICLSNGITAEVAQGIGEWQQEFGDAKPSVIFKDAGFKDDQDKTNTVQTLRQFGIENVKSI